MPRRTRLPGADEALLACASFCEQLSEIADEDAEVREGRRTAWAFAAEQGATYEEIAETCRCSPSLVKQEVSRSKGATWMAGR